MESVRIKVNFAVPVQRIWNAWTNPGIIKKWFGSDPAGIVVDAVMNICPGGAYAITFDDANGTRHTCFGTFLEVSELEFTWEWKSEPGHVSYVKIKFKQDEAISTMEFEHSNLNPESLHGYTEGWGSTFEKLRGVVVSDE